MTELTLTFTQTEVLLKVLKDRERKLVNYISRLEDVDSISERELTWDRLDCAYDSLEAIRGIIRQCER